MRLQTGDTGNCHLLTEDMLTSLSISASAETTATSFLFDLAFTQYCVSRYAMDYEGRTGLDGVFDLKVLEGGAGAGKVVRLPHEV